MTLDPHDLRRYPKMNPYRRLPYMDDKAVLRLYKWYTHCSQQHADEPRSQYHRLHLACYMEAVKRDLIKDTKGQKENDPKPQPRKAWQF